MLRANEKNINKKLHEKIQDDSKSVDESVCERYYESKIADIKCECYSKYKSSIYGYLIITLNIFNILFLFNYIIYLKLIFIQIFIKQKE